MPKACPYNSRIFATPSADSRNNPVIYPVSGETVATCSDSTMNTGIEYRNILQHVSAARAPGGCLTVKIQTASGGYYFTVPSFLFEGFEQGIAMELAHKGIAGPGEVHAVAAEQPGADPAGRRAVAPGHCVEIIHGD